MILVFNTTLKGHFLEYFHHLYLGAVDRSNKEFVFAYPEEDEGQLKQMDWPVAANVSLLKLSNCSSNASSPIKKAYHISKSLGQTVKRLKPQEVILTEFIQFFPFLPLFVHHTKVKGIRYSIYLYTWKKDSIKKRISDVLKCLIFRFSKVVSKVYVLADASAATYLNKIYHTEKFGYICDPIVELDKSKVRNIRAELGIPEHLKLVLHAGDLSNRKGTIALLRGLIHCSPEVLDRYYFLFAGRVSPQIQNTFNQLYKEVQSLTPNVKLFEGFLPFDELGSMIYSSDILMLNYLQTEQSSGFLGYTAEFEKPAVVINSGLLKKKVCRYHLGFVIPDASAKSISNFLLSDWKWEHVDNCYLKDNTVNEFVETLLG